MFFVLAHFRIQALLLERFEDRLQVGFHLEIGFLVDLKTDIASHFDRARIAQTALHFVEHQLVFVEVQQEGAQLLAFHGRLRLAVTVGVNFDREILGRPPHDLLGEFLLVFDVFFVLALLDAIERRLRDVDLAARDQLVHVTEEEGQQQGADVRTVHVRVRHDDDLVVAQLGDVEIVLADTGAERGDQAADFLVPQHLVVARLLHVEDLSL